MRASSDRPLNHPYARIAHVQKAAIDGDPRRTVLAFPGYGLQPGENTEAARGGERIRSTWHQEAGVFAGRTRGTGETAAPAVGIAQELNLDFEIGTVPSSPPAPYDPGFWGESQADAILPIPGSDYVVVRIMCQEDGGPSYNFFYTYQSRHKDDLNTVVDEAFLPDGTPNDLGTGPFDLAVHPSGTYIAQLFQSSPFIKVIGFNPATGEFGPVVANPATLPVDFGGSVKWTSDGAFILKDCKSTAQPIEAWAWSAGFGAKSAAPADVSGISAYSAYFPYGMDVSADDATVVLCRDVAPRLIKYDFAAGVFTGKEFASLDAADKPWQPRFSTIGKVVVMTDDDIRGILYAAHLNAGGFSAITYSPILGLVDDEGFGFTGTEIYLRPATWRPGAYDVLVASESYVDGIGWVLDERFSLIRLTENAEWGIVRVYLVPLSNVGGNPTLNFNPQEASWVDSSTFFSDFQGSETFKYWRRFRVLTE